MGNPSPPPNFPRPKRFPEGEARGKSRGSREIWRAEGKDFPIPPEFWWSTDNLSASIFLQGVDQKFLPCGQGRIDSVKINPSLLRMREWIMPSVKIRTRKTYWKLFGSPEFQFSKVSGLPVDIQKNLQQLRNLKMMMHSYKK